MTLAASASAGDNARAHCSEAAMSVADARDRFRARMEEAAQLHLALHLAIRLGTERMKEHVGEDPSAAMTAWTTSRSGERVETRPLRLSDAVRVLETRPYLAAETAHGQVVQWWYDFLQEAFAALFRDHVEGRRGPTGFDRLPGRDPGGSVDERVAAASRRFDHMRGHEKLPLLAAVLGVQLNPDNVELQRRHIMTRNNIEHAGGGLRARDFDVLPAPSIPMLDARHEFAEFKAGDQLKLTLWEALRPVRHLAELADELANAGSATPVRPKDRAGSDCGCATLPQPDPLALRCVFGKDARHEVRHDAKVP